MFTCRVNLRKHKASTPVDQNEFFIKIHSQAFERNPLKSRAIIRNYGINR